MKSAAIYARYSSDKQSETSIEDQIALCREFAARNAFEIVSIYSDAAKSGSSLFGRSGLLSLLADAQNRAFEAVLVENLDRISRDQEDIAGVYKRLSFSGVEITQVHGGKADKMQVGLRVRFTCKTWQTRRIGVSRGESPRENRREGRLTAIAP